MTEPDDLAMDALRRFDQPHDPDSESLQRIEARMLSRFDDVATAGVATSGSQAEIVELREVDPKPPRRPGGLWIALGAAAAVVALLGAVVLLRTDAADVDVLTTQPTSAVDDTSVIEDQLRAYCVEFVEPLVRTWALWSPVGFANEARADVLVAVEQAAQGLVDLPGPAGDEFDGRELALLQMATDARRATTLGPGGDEALIAARDAILAELDASSTTAALAECRSN